MVGRLRRSSGSDDRFRVTTRGYDKTRVKVLVVGQSPPPYGGQAIMIQRMLEHTYEGVDLRHVRMAFSQQISDAGKFQFRKVGHLVSVIARVVRERARHRTTVLYYPPAGPNEIAVLRDIAILLCTRWMFRRTIFHFHATDLWSIYASLSKPLQRLFRAAYFAPDLAIATSEFNLADGAALGARRQVVIPNFLDSNSLLEAHRRFRRTGKCRLLFVGMITPSKGIEDFLEAGRILEEHGWDFEIRLVGQPVSAEFERLVLDSACRLGISHRLSLAGELSESEVRAEYASADIFVFPTRQRSESFGIVLLEAMAYGLPLVGSGLGGVRSIIRDEINGLYVPSNDPPSLAVALERLIGEPELRERLGRTGFELVRHEYKPEIFFTRMNDAFLSQA